MRHAVVHAVDGVVRLVLQPLEDVGVVRDQVRVDRVDVTAGDQPQVASPDADTPSYLPVRISVTISSEVLPSFTLTWQPVSSRSRRPSPRPDRWSRPRRSRPRRSG